MRSVCCSSVSSSSNGPKPLARMPAAGVSSPVTIHRLLCLSKSMSPATWQHSWRLLLTRRICCSELRSRRGPLASSTNLKRESWKYPTYGSHADSEGAAFGTVVLGVVCVTTDPSDSLTSVTVCGGEDGSPQWSLAKFRSPAGPYRPSSELL